MPEESGEHAAGLWERLWQKFGDVAKRMGLAKDTDVEGALTAQNERRAAQAPHKKVGHILVEQGKMEPAHVNEVLKKQRKDAEIIEAKAKEAKRAAVPIVFPEGKAAAKPKKPTTKRAKKKAKAKAKPKAAAKPKKKAGGAKKKAVAKAKKKAGGAKKKAKKKG